MLRLWVQSMSPECVDLLNRIFQINESKRIKIEDIRQHPWYLEPLSPRYEKAMQQILAEQEDIDAQLRMASVRPLTLCMLRAPVPPCVRAIDGLRNLSLDMPSRLPWRQCSCTATGLQQTDCDLPAVHGAMRLCPIHVSEPTVPPMESSPRSLPVAATVQLCQLCAPLSQLCAPVSGRVCAVLGPRIGARAAADVRHIVRRASARPDGRPRVSAATWCETS